jgi:hypothetical protein
MADQRQASLEYKTSRVSFVGNYALALLLVIFLLLLLPLFEFSAVVSDLIILGIGLLALSLAIEPEAEIAVRKYLITNAEVVKIEGIISKKTFSMPYQSVADLRVHKSAVGRLLNFGNVIVKGMKEDILLRGVREPNVIGKVIENKIAMMKKPGKHKVVSREEDYESLMNRGAASKRTAQIDEDDTPKREKPAKGAKKEEEELEEEMNMEDEME